MWRPMVEIGMLNLEMWLFDPKANGDLVLSMIVWKLPYRQ